MKWLKKLFKKKKKYKCIYCHDFGIIQSATTILHIVHYGSGAKALQYREPTPGEFKFEVCRAYCNARKENET